MAAGLRPYLASLEGIRAYAFLMVFAVHFSGFEWNLTGRPLTLYPWLIFLQLSFVAVPIFFALSGYLITGILFDSQHRGGYFRVFYLRRAFRIFPLYYAILLLDVFVALRMHYNLRPTQLLYFVYLHNWSSDPTSIIWGKYVHVSHLWSMAVEEQFYLIWPIVVLVLRERRKLLEFCYIAVGITFVCRFFFPLLHMNAFEAYQSSFFRSDTIMLGCILALHERGPMRNLARLTKPAWVVVLVGTFTITVRAIVVGQATPYDRFGFAVIMPLLALIAAGLVVLAIQPGNAISHACERPWAVAMGKLSYSLYLLHELLVPIWNIKVIPMLSAHVGPVLGRSSGMALALALLYVASRLTFRLFEAPGMRMKTRFQYTEGLLQGPQVNSAVAERLAS